MSRGFFPGRGQRLSQNGELLSQRRPPAPLWSWGFLQHSQLTVLVRSSSFWYTISSWDAPDLGPSSTSSGPAPRARAELPELGPSSRRSGRAPRARTELPALGPELGELGPRSGNSVRAPGELVKFMSSREAHEVHEHRGSS